MSNPERKFHRRRRPGIIVAVVALFVLLRLFGGRDERPPLPGDQTVLPEGDYQVVRVVDGDTLILRVPDDIQNVPAEVRLRLLGIDCPESVKPDHPVEPFGPEASEFTRNFVSAGTVSLRFDRRLVDQYGRYLAYVFVDHTMLNEALVRAGLARVSTYPGDSEAVGRLLRRAEQEARNAQVGIWSDQAISN